jgi:polysaccharide pyruvyl transferase WcaK-like protein
VSKSFLSFLDKTDSMVVPIGIGIQAIHTINEIKLTPSVDRLMRIASEKCKYIGVRGQYSAEFLNSIGIKNVIVIGCPSIMNIPPQAPASYLDKLIFAKNLESYRVRFAWSMTNYLNNDLYKSALLRIAKNTNSTYFSQTEIDLYKFSQGRPFDREELSKFELSLCNVDDSHFLISFLAKNCKLFLEPSRWINFLRSYDLYCGERLHGAIAALDAGVPSLLLSSDLRTLEVAEFLKIPHINCLLQPLEGKNLSLDFIYSKLQNEISRFSTHLPEVNLNYYNFLVDNSLTLNPDLVQLTSKT